MAEPQRLFRKLTPGNWRDFDDTPKHIVKWVDGKTTPISYDEWAERLLRADLSEKVPTDIRNLFEVAQGTMCYGNFFYPLFTLGTEQLFRVMDAALKQRCDGWGVPAKVRTFHGRVGWMVETGRWNDEERSHWEAARSLRNSSSHSTKQSLIGPDMAERLLHSTAELLNNLFEVSG